MHTRNRKIPTKAIGFCFLLALNFLLCSCSKPFVKDDDDAKLYGLTEDNNSIVIDPKTYTDEYNWDYLYSDTGEFEVYQENKFLFREVTSPIEFGGLGDDFYIGDYGLEVNIWTERDCHPMISGFGLWISSNSYEEEDGVKIFKNFVSQIENESIRKLAEEEKTTVVPGEGTLEITNKGRFWEANGEIRFNFKTYKVLKNPCFDSRDYSTMEDKNKHDTTLVIRFNKMKYYKILPKDFYLINKYSVKHSEGKAIELGEVLKVDQDLYRARKALDDKGFLTNDEMEKKLKKENKISSDQRLGDGDSILTKLPRKTKIGP